MAHPRVLRKRTLRFAVLQRDEWICAYCWCVIGADNATVDHLVPASRGGKFEVRNLVAACNDCNGRRRDLSVRAFLTAESLRRGVTDVHRAVDALVRAIQLQVAKPVPWPAARQLERFDRAVRRVA